MPFVPFDLSMFSNIFNLQIRYMDGSRPSLTAIINSKANKMATVVSLFHSFEKQVQRGKNK